MMCVAEKAWHANQRRHPTRLNKYGSRDNDNAIRPSFDKLAHNPCQTTIFGHPLCSRYGFPTSNPPLAFSKCVPLTSTVPATFLFPLGRRKAAPHCAHSASNRHLPSPVSLAPVPPQLSRSNQYWECGDGRVYAIRRFEEEGSE